MSAVIKSGSGGAGLHVRELAFDPPPSRPSAERQRIADLEQRLEAAAADLTELRRQQAQADAAIAKARSDGREEGLAEGSRIADDRLAAVEAMISKAVAAAAAAFAESLKRLEATSGELAAIALERIVGDANSRQDLILETLGRAVQQLSADTVVAVEVSGADFGDVARISNAAPEGCTVRALADLPSGSCRLRLQMGEIDLDLDGQMARLQALLAPARAIPS